MSKPPSKANKSIKCKGSLDPSVFDENVSKANLADGNLTEFPTPVFKCTYLRQLLLSNNTIKLVPPEITKLTYLQILRLDGCNLADLPNSIGELSALKSLHIHNNQIRILPQTLCNLSSLVTLDVHENKIKSLPTNLVKLSKLKDLYVHGNPIIHPPMNVCNRGVKAVFKYLSDTNDPAAVSDNPMSVKQSSKRFLLKRQKSFTLPQTSKKEAPKKFSLKREDSVFQEQNQLFFTLAIEFWEHLGNRKTQEDKQIMLPDVPLTKEMMTEDTIAEDQIAISFFCVYDGHGGVLAAEHAVTHLHEDILRDPAFKINGYNDDLTEAIVNGCRKCDEDFLAWAKNNGRKRDGTTVAGVILVNNQLFCFNLGDSRVVLCRSKKAVRVSYDHKPNLPEELASIEAAGGFVREVRKGVFRVNNDLALSRCIGDIELKDPKPICSNKPAVLRETLTPEDQFVIVASDGLFDVLSDQKCVDLIQGMSHPEKASRALVNQALEKGATDNTTVIVAYFNWNVDSNVVLNA